MLIVDDQESARNGLKAFFSHIPEFEVVGEASNGQEAIEWLATNSTDMVLMDIEMPVMDGVAATQHLRKLNLPLTVVLMSLSVERETESLAAGADAFISKSDSPEQLLAVLKSLESEHREV